MTTSDDAGWCAEGAAWHIVGTGEPVLTVCLLTVQMARISTRGDGVAVEKLPLLNSRVCWRAELRQEEKGKVSGWIFLGDKGHI